MSCDKTGKKPPRQRRVVTNADFDRAYYGVKGDAASERAAEDNRNVIGAVLQRYGSVMSDDDLHTCGLTALWRTLQYHQNCYNQKFTTSLHRFTHWECKRELRRLRGAPGKSTDKLAAKLFEGTAPSVDEEKARAVSEDFDHVMACLDKLPDEWMRSVIRQYYLDGMTMRQVGRANGYSKEAARLRIHRATQALRALCHDALEPGGLARRAGQGVVSADLTVSL